MPGPVIGMVLMVVILLVRRSVPDELDRTARGLLGYLSLLFVPAGVGVMRYLDVLRHDAIAVAVALIGSTVITMWVTAATMTAVMRWMRR